MATRSSFTSFCKISSRVKGDHIYQAKPKINDKCDCFPEPENQSSPRHAIIVKKHSKTEDVIGHVPDTLAKVLFQPLMDGNISISCTITGQSRPAPEGVWVQGGGIEIPCSYEVVIRKDEIELKKQLKTKIAALKK